MRWFTCTPVAFGGGPDFFARDSGLMCRGFQALGCESRAVMPGTPQDGDEADLIRTEFGNLESAEWWRSHQLDGIVLYAWGSPRFRSVASAIRDAGIFLVLNQDNGGLISPLAGFRGWLREQWILSGAGRFPGGRLRFAKLAGSGLTYGLLAVDPLRAVHLRQGSIIACVSPAAADHYRKLCRIYGGDELANRVELVPHPVEQHFDYAASPETKSRQIVCIGRWDDRLQKRTLLMQAVIQKLLARDSGVHVEMLGNLTAELQAWHNSLGADLQTRVYLRGHVDRTSLARILRRSRIFYSSSAFESFGIAAAEALCCGCSVVAGKSPSMASFEWFVSNGSGLLADTDDAQGHLAALEDELTRWDKGNRNAGAISKSWTALLHADRIAARVLALRQTAR